MSRPAILLIAALAASGAYSIGLKAYLLNREDPETVLPRGEAAPTFELATLDGTEMDLAQIAGENKLVVVNFWATWCQPCRIEMPQLERIYDEYHGQGLEILAISDEEPGTIEEVVEPYLLQIGFLERTPRGRQVTPQTARHMHAALPGEGIDQAIGSNIDSTAR